MWYCKFLISGFGTLASEALNGDPGTWDIWPKWSQGPGTITLGTRTICSIFNGTRDQSSNPWEIFGWDQGPHDKKWIGPGTKWDHRYPPCRASLVSGITHFDMSWGKVGGLPRSNANE